MHHNHAAAGHDTTVQLLFVVLVMIATAIHWVLARTRPLSGPTPSVGGHVLMGVAMACMLLPDGWDPVPWPGWAGSFFVVGIASAVAAVRTWRAGARGASFHHYELVVGSAAMVVMAVDGEAWTVPSPITVVLVIGLLVEMCVDLARAVRPIPLVTAPVPAWSSDRLGRGGESGIMPAPAGWSMAARVMMVAAMVYMLAGHG